MKKIIFLLVLTTLTNVLIFRTNAQSFQRTFGGTHTDDGSSVQQTSDGGYVIAGATYSFGAGNYDVYLIKTNSDASVFWTKTFEGAGGDYGKSVQQTTDGGYIIAGYTSSFGAGGGSDIYLIKTNSDASAFWTKTFGGTRTDIGRSVQQTTDGGYIIAGETYSFGAGNWDVYLIKTNSDASAFWAKTFGGTGDERGYSVQQTTDGGYVITGETNSFGSGGSDVYLIKTNSDASVFWTKTFGGTGNERGNSVQQTTDGGYVIAGYTGSFGAGGGSDVYLIKTDSDGNALWTKTFGGAAGGDVGYSVQQTTDGGYVIGGYTGSFGSGNWDAYLLKTNSDASTFWTKTFGGTGIEYGYSVHQTNDGGYIIAGQTANIGGIGAGDVYLIKTDSNGASGCNETSPVSSSGSGGTSSSGGVSLSGGTSSAGGTSSSGGIKTDPCNPLSVEPLSVYIANLEIVSIYPSFAEDEITIVIHSIQNTAAGVEAFNVLGQKVYGKTVSLQKGQIEIKVPVSNLTIGQYMFCVMLPSGERTQKRVVVK